MKPLPILSKLSREQRKAVTLSQGVTAFFCSTFLCRFQENTTFPAISREKAKCGALDNLLPDNHYFSAHLAKRPFSVAVRMKGQETVSKTEVRP